MNIESTSKPHVLITGGAGLIGTASKTYFEQRGWTVSTLDLKQCDLDGRPIDHIGDIVEFKLFQDILTDIDGILHLAAVSRVIDAELNKEECTRVNVNGTKRLLGPHLLPTADGSYSVVVEVYGSLLHYQFLKSMESHR